MTSWHVVRDTGDSCALMCRMQTKKMHQSLLLRARCLTNSPQGSVPPTTSFHCHPWVDCRLPHTLSHLESQPEEQFLSGPPYVFLGGDRNSGNEWEHGLPFKPPLRTSTQPPPLWPIGQSTSHDQAHHPQGGEVCPPLGSHGWEGVNSHEQLIPSTRGAPRAGNIPTRETELPGCAVFSLYPR